MPRQSIEMASFSHSNPIPGASRIGPMIASSVIVGRDPGSSTIPDSADEQIENCFVHIGECLKATGADWRHVLRITFFVPDGSYRELCNPPWVERFPDAASRPARHTQVVGGKGPVTCEFIAYVDD